MKGEIRAWTHADWDANKKSHHIKKIFGTTTLDFSKFEERLNQVYRTQKANSQKQDILRNLKYFWAMIEFEEGHDELTMARRGGGDVHIPKTEIFEMIL